MVKLFQNLIPRYIVFDKVYLLNTRIVTQMSFLWQGVYHRTGDQFSTAIGAYFPYLKYFLLKPIILVHVNHFLCSGLPGFLCNYLSTLEKPSRNTLCVCILIVLQWGTHTQKGCTTLSKYVLKYNLFIVTYIIVVKGNGGGLWYCALFSGASD